MEATSPKLDYSVCKEDTGGIPVIIVAAGNSSRMGGKDKQLMSVLGIPVIIRTLTAFERSPYISRIILVTKPDSIPQIELLAEKYLITKLSDITEGGETRQKSVIAGISRLSADEDKVLISDGARMFVTDDMIKGCAEALKRHDGCLCAIKVTDTVKSVEDGSVKSTVDRSKLYLAQTPQGITVKLYKKALEQSNSRDFTDDVSVLESIGADVVTVAGSTTNIKITTPDDIALAELLLKGK